MAPSRRQSIGRSPLVNPQRQITSFFSKSNSPSPSPDLSKRNPNPNTNSNPNPSRSPTPSSSPATPSPFNPKRKKPLLVIGGGADRALSPSSPPTADKQSFGEDVIGKRIKVYWPLDKAWYEGCVKSFDKKDGKHLVQYQDGDEESLDLMSEKIEWVQESANKFKRLRRGSLAFKRVVIEEEEEEDEAVGRVDDVEENEQNGFGDDSSDEDWGKNEVVEEDDEDVDMDLIDEQEHEENGAGKSKHKRGGKLESKKRKESKGEKLVSAKKSKTDVDASKGGFKVSVMEPLSNSQGK